MIQKYRSLDFLNQDGVSCEDGSRFNADDESSLDADSNKIAINEHGSLDSDFAEKKVCEQTKLIRHT